MIRILIADDHAMVRDGFRRILDGHPDLEITAEAADGDEALEALCRSEVDVMVLDLAMPGPGFLETLKRVLEARPGLPVLVVSAYPEGVWALRAFKEGAAGYLTKTRSAGELAHAIRHLHARGKYVTPTLAERLASRLAGTDDLSPHEALSRREYQVLCLLGSGKMVKTVARELRLSARTVSTYRRRALEKLRLRSTADMIRYVVENDLTLRS